mgnify:CR=1 FL=1
MFKLAKKFVDTSLSSMKATQACLIFISLVTMIYFILNLMNIPMPEPVKNVFDIIYNFQSNVYKPELALIPVDFTFMTFAIEMLLIAGLLVYSQSFLIEFEEHLNKVIKDDNRRYEEKFNKNLAQSAKKIENQNNYFAILFNIKMAQNAKMIYDQQKKIDIDVKKQETLNRLRNLIVSTFGVYVETIASGSLAYFTDINLCNKVFDLILDFQNKVRQELMSYNIKIDVVTAVCIAGKHDRKETYVPKLEKLLNLALPNRIMVLNEFKNRYEILKEKTYEFTELGTYALGDNFIDVLSVNKKA